MTAPTHTGTTAQKNLVTAGSTDRWERARLVACSIEKKTREGVVIQPYGPVGKMMIEEAAEFILIPMPTLSQYLKAWNLAAIAGLCTSSGGLRPEDGLTARLPDRPFDGYWNNAA